jgi:hypothetical protein
MNRICKRAQARNNHLTALADYITALAIGLALTALALAYFDIL